MNGNDLLDAAEASKLLHLNVKQVQKLAREGRVKASRVGRKWLFSRAALERELGLDAAGTGAEFLDGLSARNRLRGTVVALAVDGLMAEVRVKIGDQELVSVITRASAERLGLVVGLEVYAVIKSTEVMIGRGGGR